MAKRKNETVEKPTKKPHHSLPETQFSICIPSTIISSSNAKNLQQITNIAYQLAKVITIYNVPEIIILDIPSIQDRNQIIEAQSTTTVKIDKKIKFNETIESTSPNELNEVNNNDDNNTNINNNGELLASLLQFFITPPYLVKSMFKSNKYVKKFKYSEKLPKIPTLPFMNNNEVLKDFKEGLTIAKKSPGKKKNKNKLKTTRYVNIGNSEPLELTHDVPTNVRVTVDIKNKKIVSPLTAYGIIGNKSSFGYYTRVVKNFNEIFTKSSFPDGYTSSVFIDCDNYFNNGVINNNLERLSFDKQNNKVLLVFGNPKDLEFSFNQDKSLDLPDFKALFDKFLNIPTNIRIEDAIMMALTKLYN